MAQVTITVAGKIYRMACADGEEEHVAALAGTLDSKIGELRQSFGEIGDMRLHVMAALFFADELFETRKRLTQIETDLASLRSDGSERDTETRAQIKTLATGIDTLSERLVTLSGIVSERD